MSAPDDDDHERELAAVSTDQFWVRSLLPQIDDCAVPVTITLEEEECRAFQDALERTLQPEHLASIGEAMTTFIRWVCLTGCGLPAPREYLLELRDRLDSMAQAVDDLIPWITPLHPPEHGASAITEAQAKKWLGGPATRKVAVKANKLGDETMLYLTAADYLRCRIAVLNPEILSAVLSLPYEIQKIRTEVAANLPDKPSGQYGYYEVNFLFESLLNVAAASGDELALPSGDMDEDGPTPAFSFVCEVLMAIQDRVPAIVGNSNLNEEQQKLALARFNKCLDREVSLLRKPLTEAKGRLQGVVPAK